MARMKQNFHDALTLSSRNSLLPPGLADETLRTLALMIPSSDPATRKWFARLPNYQDLDKRAVRYRRLKTDDRQLEKFPFWRERLLMLKQVFDEAQPQSISQWWYDRRNGVQWCAQSSHLCVAFINDAYQVYLLGSCFGFAPYHSVWIDSKYRGRTTSIRLVQSAIASTAREFLIVAHKWSLRMQTM